ncbi:class I mannose-6-phosphate isomerase [Qipengyuania sp. JC766]|uniref:class I mannose-6-phosphate isomerase n=1 Tax=Qipengyuania sp. JC766 TaxID=3232139 RepID=UPI00345A5FA5
MQKLPQIRVEKVWGRDVLPAPFDAGGKRIGEIWFDPVAPLQDLLAKYLFTSEKLSVQVHPDDARAPEGARGKEECWLILDAEPGAPIAVGLARKLDDDELKAAALDGSIESLLVWHEVRRGDFFYLPAGTVHAIGAGITLVEIQQNSDVTYRLYDYGRPRELHLDEALAIADRGPADPQHFASFDLARPSTLVDGPKFLLDLCVGSPPEAIRRRYSDACLVLPLSGHLKLDGLALAPGEAANAAGASGIACDEDAAYLLARPVSGTDR